VTDAPSQRTILALTGGLRIFFFLPRDLDYYLGDPNCPVRYCKLRSLEKLI
jgi:hypothetical protein